MAPRRYLLLEANHEQLLERPPKLAVLPWGATESHNHHLPYGTDGLEAGTIAEKAAEQADAQGAEVVVLPTVPFGNDEQQLDQVCAVSVSTSTAYALLRDVVRSLVTQGIDRLVIVNGHGGNHFQPLVRDLMGEFDILIVVVDFFRLCPEVFEAVFENPGDHADEFETSVMLHLYPDLVEMQQAQSGSANPFQIDGIRQSGVWTPRPWSATHPDTGCGDPSTATEEKGRAYCEAIIESLGKLMVSLANAEKGMLPYL